MLVQKGTDASFAPLVTCTLKLAGSWPRGRRIAIVRHERSVDAMTQGRARQYTGEKMDTNTLLIIVLVVLLLGGGGFFYRRRA